MSHIDNVKEYYAQWTDGNSCEFDKSGLHLICSGKRDQRKEGYSSNYLVYCVIRNDSILLSYSPSLSDSFGSFKTENEQILIKVLYSRFSTKLQRRLIYFYNSDSVSINTESVITMQSENYIDYEKFFITQNPGLTVAGWLRDYYEYLCMNQLCFGIFQDSRLVCATDAPFIPYLPDIIAEPGINTLAEYRGMGYAKAVCAEFIKHQIGRKKTIIWTCRQDNLPSQKLAASLGFVKFADLYAVEGEQ